MHLSNPVNILFIDKNRILLVKRTAKDKECKNTWSIPGGGTEIDENLEKALHREIREELNCKIKWFKYFKSYVVKLSSSHTSRAIYFYGEIDGKIVLNSDELSDYKWFLIDSTELLKLNLAFNQKEVISDFINFLDTK